MKYKLWLLTSTLSPLHLARRFVKATSDSSTQNLDKANLSGRRVVWRGCVWWAVEARVIVVWG